MWCLIVSIPDLCHLSYLGLRGTGFIKLEFLMVYLTYRSFMFSALCLLCLCARLFVCALWSPAWGGGGGVASWLLFAMSGYGFVTFPLVSWFRCGI